MVDNKKLLVIGGASQHTKVVETAQRMGIKVYVADHLEKSPAKIKADVSLLVDVMDVDNLVRICNEEKIDGAIATSLDACQIPYQRVCEEMGYPCFGNAEQYKILTNKELFKKCCKKYGIDVIPSYTIANIENGEEVAYPVFVKPVDSRGSRGQMICNSKEETLEAIKYAQTYSSEKNVIIERYMGNYQDFTVAYLVVNGNAMVVRTGDRFGGTKGSGLENLCIASCSPSLFSKNYMEYVNDRVIKMLKGIGVTNGPVFFQGFIEGKTVRFYDPGLRYAGGEYERILKKATGIDIIEPLIEFAVSGKISYQDFRNDIYKLNGKKLIQLDPTLNPGKIHKIEGVDTIRNMKDVLCVSQRVSEGDVIQKTSDLRQRFGEICILSDDIESEIDNISSVQELLKVYNSDCQNMICDPFDANRIVR